jgi:hypothetical protein
MAFVSASRRADIVAAQALTHGALASKILLNAAIVIEFGTAFIHRTHSGLVGVDR